MGDFIPFVKLGIAFEDVWVYSYMRGTKPRTGKSRTEWFSIFAMNIFLGGT